MTLDEAIEYIEREQSDEIEEIRSKIDGKKNEIESLEDDILELEDEMDKIKEDWGTDALGNDKESQEVKKVIRHYKSEILRIEESIKSGLFKNVSAIQKQVDEYKKKLKAY